MYANLSENDTLPWHRHRTITSVHSAHGLLSHRPPLPIPLSQATGCRDTGTAQAEPPCGWHSTQMVAAGKQPSQSWSFLAAGGQRQPGNRKLRGGVLGERGPFQSWPHLRSWAEKILVTSCQRCWGLGLRDTKQTAKQPTEDSEVIWRLTH